MHCSLLPFCLIETIGFTTPFVAGIVVCAYVGLDALGTVSKNPLPRGLPLDAIGRTIESTCASRWWVRRVRLLGMKVKRRQRISHLRSRLLTATGPDEQWS